MKLKFKKIWADLYKNKFRSCSKQGLREKKKFREHLSRGKRQTQEKKSSETHKKMLKFAWRKIAKLRRCRFHPKSQSDSWSESFPLVYEMCSFDPFSRMPLDWEEERKKKFILSLKVISFFWKKNFLKSRTRCFLLEQLRRSIQRDIFQLSNRNHLI